MAKNSVLFRLLLYVALCASGLYSGSVLGTPLRSELMPLARRLESVRQAREADVFGVYSASERRVVHVGLVERFEGEYMVTVEGNSRNRVERRRRHWLTVHAVADWISSREGGAP